MIYIPTMVIFVCLQVPTALAQDPATLITMRFLAGFFGSPVLAVGAGSMVDIFKQEQLPYVLGIWGSMAALGPMLGPLFGGFAYQNHNWRWSIWAVAWMAGFTLFLMCCCLPETSADKLLRAKAARVRKLTGDERWASAADKNFDMTLASIGRTYLLKPIELLLFEPIGASLQARKAVPCLLFLVFLLSLYLAVLYGLEYLFFEVFPFVFSGIYGWSPGVTGLGFFGVLAGIVFGLIFQMWFIRFRYTAIWAKTGKAPALEQWLWTMMFGSVCVPVSMFWFGWSANAQT